MPDFPILSEALMRQRLAPPAGDKIRLIIDTDAHNEIDDQFAIAWALLSQDRFEIEGFTAAPYSFQHHRQPLLDAYHLLKQTPNPNLPDTLKHYEEAAARFIANETDPHSISYVGPAEGMELSYQEIIKVCELLGEDVEGRVFRGAQAYLNTLASPIRSEAADFIVERALADDDRPVYIAAIGCLPNVASAILMEPKIIEKIVVLWTSAYPSYVSLSNQSSLNLVQDKLSSQLIFDCGVPHVYLPGYYIGEQLTISLPEMAEWVRGRGHIGDYLYHLYTHNPIHSMRGISDHFGRTWVMWDLINFAWLLNPGWVPSHLVKAPILNDELFWEHDEARHWMCEAYQCDRDAIFRDFFTKLANAAP